jgi:hypothetical protein
LIGTFPSIGTSARDQKHNIETVLVLQLQFASLTATDDGVTTLRFLEDQPSMYPVFDHKAGIVCATLRREALRSPNVDWSISIPTTHFGQTVGTI